MIQSAKEEMASFQSVDCTYIVQVVNNDRVQAIMRREAGSMDVHVMTTFK